MATYHIPDISQRLFSLRTSKALAVGFGVPLVGIVLANPAAASPDGADEPPNDGDDADRSDFDDDADPFELNYLDVDDDGFSVFMQSEIVDSTTNVWVEDGIVSQAEDFTAPENEPIERAVRITPEKIKAESKTTGAFIPIVEDLTVASTYLESRMKTADSGDSLGADVYETITAKTNGEVAVKTLTIGDAEGKPLRETVRATGGAGLSRSDRLIVADQDGFKTTETTEMTASLERGEVVFSKDVTYGADPTDDDGNRRKRIIEAAELSFDGKVLTSEYKSPTHRKDIDIDSNTSRTLRPLGFENVSWHSFTGRKIQTPVDGAHTVKVITGRELFRLQEGELSQEITFIEAEADDTVKVEVVHQAGGETVESYVIKLRPDQYEAEMIIRNSDGDPIGRMTSDRGKVPSGNEAAPQFGAGIYRFDLDDTGSGWNNGSTNAIRVAARTNPTTDNELDAVLQLSQRRQHDYTEDKNDLVVETLLGLDSRTGAKKLEVADNFQGVNYEHRTSATSDANTAYLRSGISQIDPGQSNFETQKVATEFELGGADQFRMTAIEHTDLNGKITTKERTQIEPTDNIDNKNPGGNTTGQTSEDTDSDSGPQTVEVAATNLAAVLSVAMISESTTRLVAPHAAVQERKDHVKVLNALLDFEEAWPTYPGDLDPNLRWDETHSADELVRFPNRYLGDAIDAKRALLEIEKQKVAFLDDRAERQAAKDRAGSDVETTQDHAKEALEQDLDFAQFEFDTQFAGVVHWKKRQIMAGGPGESALMKIPHEIWDTYLVQAGHEIREQERLVAEASQAHQEKPNDATEYRLEQAKKLESMAREWESQTRRLVTRLQRQQR